MTSYNRGTRRRQGGLAGAGCTDDRHRLARVDLEVDVAQDELVGVREVEVDVLEAQVPAGSASSRVPADEADRCRRSPSPGRPPSCASWAIAKMKPSASMGQTKQSIRMMKATRVPDVTVALADRERAQQQDDDRG